MRGRSQSAIDRSMPTRTLHIVLTCSTSFLLCCQSGPTANAPSSRRLEAVPGEDASAAQPPFPSAHDADGAGDPFARRNVSERITFEAVLRRDNCGPKRSKAADWICHFLIRDDGTRWLGVSEHELSTFDGERVRVTGRTFDPSPYVPHLGGQYFDIEVIEVVSAGHPQQK